MRGAAEADDEEVVVDAGEDEDEVATGQGPSAPRASVVPSAPAENAVSTERRKLDLTRLQAALQDLLACRQLLDGVMKEG
jgi:hypothetical protein